MCKQGIGSRGEAVQDALALLGEELLQHFDDLLFGDFQDGHDLV